MAFPKKEKRNFEDTVPGSSEFRRTIRAERVLSDRNGTEFSLVLFTISAAARRAGTHTLIRHLKKRMRASDSLGWFDGKRLGALLPGTPPEGAVRFAHEGVSIDPRSEICTGYGVTRYPDTVKRGGDFSLADLELQRVFLRKMPVWKRTIDIIGSSIALILASPVMILTALFIRTVSRGPVFFRQQRVGYRGKTFVFLKFRTMHVNNDESTHKEHLHELINSDIPMMKLDHGKDPRIIPGGNVIRKFSIDELPQFFNVLKGDMSIIGPRPCIPYEAEEFRRWHSHRFDVYPGLSGLWQVSGKNRPSFKEMIRLDIRYANTMSLRQDILIILRTFPTLAGIALEKRDPVPRQRLSGEPGRAGATG